MPSPFPGVDPYLEGDLWTTLHFGLSAEIIRQIAPRLRPRYAALPVERMVLDTPDDISVTTVDIYPDIGVVESPEQSRSYEEATTLVAPLQLATVIPKRIPHVSIEIRDTKRRRLVTAIEMLSLTNKRGRGREEYLAKRRRVLLSTVHLLEIDLLRRGQRVPMEQPLPNAPYFVFLNRVEKRPISDVWPIALDQPLPKVPLPLLPGDADVELDLQAAFDSVYDILSYDTLIDYLQLPDIPLDEEAQAWANQRLREAGLR
ncbi:MAG TPA: DUF4058 family protein [Roseiflexaceae bacterium]